MFSDFKYTSPLINNQEITLKYNNLELYSSYHLIHKVSELVTQLLFIKSY